MGICVTIVLQDSSPGPPVALDKSPGPRHIHRVPRVAEPVVLELDPGLVARRLAVALDHHTVQTSVAEGEGVSAKEALSEDASMERLTIPS